MTRTAFAFRSIARRALPLAAAAGLLALQGCAATAPDNKWSRLSAREQHANVPMPGVDGMRPAVVYLAGADGSAIRLPSAVATRLVMRNGMVAAVPSEGTVAQNR